MLSRRLSAVLMLVALCWAGPAMAQDNPFPGNGGDLRDRLGPVGQPPETYTIRSIRVEGLQEERLRQFVRSISGLEEGEEVTIPGGSAIADAIRSIYDAQYFSDVAILRENAANGQVDLVIRVTMEPTLADYSFEGAGGYADELREKVSLLRGRPVRPAEVVRSKQIIENFYDEEGYVGTEVSVQRKQIGDQGVILTFYVDPGREAEVEEIDILGNEALSDDDVIDALDEVREDRWWRFWSSATFDREVFEEDLERIITYYNSRGYYDARIVRDSVYLTPEGLHIDIKVHEGPKFYISDIEWQGNTVYTDAVLTGVLGLEEGDVYDETKLQENLYGTGRGSGVLGLYLNRGYLRANVEPSIRVVGGDSLEIVFEVTENAIYEFGDVNIAGNTKTKEHVIRRELYTVPGNTFSRDAIRESIRRLMQLKYFSRESLAGGPNIDIDEAEKEVNLTYTVEEVGSDQLELSGTYGRFGLVLQLRFTFNNFSAGNIFNWDAYRPLPTGDGQRLSVGIQTNGTYYQNYSISFTEPWFRGRPTPIGGSVAYQYLSCLPYQRTCGDDSFQRFSSRFFYSQRLDWPDDKFMTSSSINYQYFENDSLYRSSLRPLGVSNQISFTQSLSRNSLNNPLFPSRGSEFELSLEVAPPLGDLVQYYKVRFNSAWHVPLIEDLSLSFGTDLGYVGSLTGEEVQFGRFDVGGSPLDYGRYSYYSEQVFMRGYPSSALNPRRRVNGQLFPVDGTILTKYTSELRWMAIQSPQLQAAPYLFLDAANTWASFDTFNPLQLYRSAGVGARLYLPIIGLIEVSYGYNFDRFLSLETGQPAPRDWTFQISLGRGF